MNNVIEYKGYWTKVEYSAEDGILFGKIEGISDLVNFECERASEAEAAFHEAVDDYLAFCEDLGQDPDRAYKGTFNVRISPELHRLADMQSSKRGVSLNQLVANALDEYLHPQMKEINTTVYLSVPMMANMQNPFQRFQSLSAGKFEKTSTEVHYAYHKC